jgi:hypothetical protein
LKSGPESGLRDGEAAAVGRWRGSIMSVAIEEMGHLALVNNLLVALGGAPHFDRPNLPPPPGYHPAGFVIRLTPFDAATLEHFIFLERPDGARRRDHVEFQPETEKRRGAPARRITPSANDYDTIGEFYGDIRHGLIALADRRGDDLFIDAGQGQLTPDIADLPGLMAIRDLESAVQALDTIVEQGEGSTGDREDCHFARFRAIKGEWAELLERNPGFVPAHPAAADPVMRRPLTDDERVWITAAPAAARLDLANAIYGETLILLTQAYGYAVPKPLRQALVGSAITLMQAMGRLGVALAEMPAGDDHPGVHAGLTFAMPRNLGQRVTTGVARVVLERIAELQAASVQVGAPEIVPMLRDAEEALAALALKEPV